MFEFLGIFNIIFIGILIKLMILVMYSLGKIKEKPDRRLGDVLFFSVLGIFFISIMYIMFFVSAQHEAKQYRDDCTSYELIDEPIHRK